MNTLLTTLIIIITIASTVNFIFNGMIPFASAKSANDTEGKIKSVQKMCISFVGYLIVTIMLAFI